MFYTGAIRQPWDLRNKIFEKSLEQRKGAKPFVFFEGPPTANARPAIHHFIGRAFKDLFCRFQTMRGHFVGRKSGWDTQGLPVEIEVEKALGLKSKKDPSMGGITMQFKDNDHIVQTCQGGGKENEQAMSIEYTRVR